METYTFSEPKVILTDRLIGISEWLPDNQRLLITRAIKDGKREVFETINVQTGATQRYAEQARYRTKPVWVEAEQAVAFADIPAVDQVVLRISHGLGAPVEDVVSDLASPFLAVSVDGQQVAFVARAEHGQPQVVHTGRGRQVRPLRGPIRQSASSSTPVQLDEWEALRAAWRPDGQQIAFYHKGGFYLTDTTTGVICAVDLGGDSRGNRWALKAIWSPNGRFLAARTSIGGDKGNLPFVDITILDTVTGALHYIDMDVRSIYEVAWLPNSRHLLALGRVGATATEGTRLGLFVADAITSNFRRVLPEHTFSVGIYGTEGGGLASSLDGHNVATRCPLPAEEQPADFVDRLCVIELHNIP